MARPAPPSPIEPPPPNRSRADLLLAAGVAFACASAAAPAPAPRAINQRMTRSGMFEPPDVPADPVIDPMASGDFTTLDMVSRLDPQSLRWLDSSPAEQDFLGWSLADLRQKSFLEVIHP